MELNQDLNRIFTNNKKAIILTFVYVAIDSLAEEHFVLITLLSWIRDLPISQKSETVSLTHVLVKLPFH